MSHSLVTPIDKIMFWRVDTWKKYASQQHNLTLRVHVDQLFITSENKIIESISMKEKLKGIYKDDVLVLYISRTAQEIRKIKFQIKSNANDCFEELNKYFPVVSHNSLQSKNIIRPKYQNVDDVITLALNKKEQSSSTTYLPPSFKSFVRLCLLDPSFPKMVQETENIINNKTV